MEATTIENHKMCKRCPSIMFIIWVLKKQLNVPKFISIKIANSVGYCYVIDIVNKRTITSYHVCTPKWLVDLNFDYDTNNLPVYRRVRNALKEYEKIVNFHKNIIRQSYDKLLTTNQALYVFITTLVIRQIKKLGKMSYCENKETIRTILEEFNPRPSMIDFDMFCICTHLNMSYFGDIDMSGNQTFPALYARSEEVNEIIYYFISRMQPTKYVPAYLYKHIKKLEEYRTDNSAEWYINMECKLGLI